MSFSWQSTFDHSAANTKWQIFTVQRFLVFELQYNMYFVQTLYIKLQQSDQIQYAIVCQWAFIQQISQKPLLRVVVRQCAHWLKRGVVTEITSRNPSCQRKKLNS